MGTTADYGTAASPRSGATSLSAWAAAVHARLEALRTELGLGTASGRNVPAVGNAGAAEVVLGADTRLADSRTPVAHAASHGSGGSDAVTVAESQVTGLVTDLAAKAPASRAITAGAGLTGGGSLAADRTLDVGAGPGISVGADAVSVDTTWADARYRTMVRATFSNADTVCAAATRYLGQVGTMTAARTVTLPAASAVPAGTEIIVADDSGTVTATKTITIARAGSDLINGVPSVVIGQAFGARRLCSDGVSRWSVDGGVLRGSSNLADVAVPLTAITNLGGLQSRITHPSTDDVLVEVYDAAKGRWQVVHYDSGWRDVSASLNGDWSGHLRVRRVGRVVFWRWVSLTGTAALAYMVPAGFRHSDHNSHTTWPVVTYAGAIGLLTTYGGSYGVTVALAAKNYSGTHLEVGVPTDDAIPSSLPGTMITLGAYN